MTDKLDKSRPFGTIHGQHTARFYQNGKHFDANGARVYLEGEEKPAPVGAPPKAPPAAIPPIDPPKVAEQEQAEEPIATPEIVGLNQEAGGEEEGAGENGGSDFAGMHWSQLKKLVEEAGGTWSNKADAIAFLSRQP